MFDMMIALFDTELFIDLLIVVRIISISDSYLLFVIISSMYISSSNKHLAELLLLRRKNLNSLGRKDLYK